MLLSACLLGVSFLALETSAKKSPTKTAPSKFCENYASCLQNLEIKQRECLRFPSEAMDLRGSSTMRAAVNTNTNSTIGCTKRKRKDLQHELAELHLRRTEVIRDCIKNNAHQARSILNPQKERKCLVNSEKLVTFVELVKNDKADGQKRKRLGKSENAKGKGNKRKQDAGSSTIPELTTTSSTTSSTKNVDIGPMNGAKRRAKRRAALAANKKTNAKTCKRAKKSVMRKCHQISKCCSIVNECQLLADAIDAQIAELKMEFKAPSCQN